MVRIMAWIAVVFSCLLGASVAGAEPPHRVERGDTLWDLSERFWSDAGAWPELWALNPHIHNPHWIYPGDLVHLQRPVAERARGRSVRLPLERLRPAGAPEATGGTAADAGAPPAAGGKSVASTIRLSRQRSQDYISSHPVTRLGAIRPRLQVKVFYGTGDDLEFAVSPGHGLRSGDVATVFDDSLRVVHPETGELIGYYVQILGHVEVFAVQGDRAVGRIVEGFDAVEEGDGVMAYRPPVEELQPREARVGVEGLILSGRPERSIFATDDLVFLDKGTLHGLEPGAVLEIPVVEGERDAQGVVDLGLPLATLVVVSVEDKTSSGLIVSSRAAVEEGDRFVVAPFSP